MQLDPQGESLNASPFRLIEIKDHVEAEVLNDNDTFYCKSVFCNEIPKIELVSFIQQSSSPSFSSFKLGLPPHQQSTPVTGRSCLNWSGHAAGLCTEHS
jgi:hypothetical protein